MVQPEVKFGRRAWANRETRPALQPAPRSPLTGRFQGTPIKTSRWALTKPLCAIRRRLDFRKCCGRKVLLESAQLVAPLGLGLIQGLVGPVQ